MDEPNWDTAFAEEPVRSPAVAERLARAQRLALIGLCLAVASIALPFVFPSGLASFGVIGIGFPALAPIAEALTLVIVGVALLTSVGLPIAAVACATVALLRTRHRALLRYGAPTPADRGPVGAIRVLCSITIAVAVALPLLVGAVVGALWYDGYRQEQAWVAAFDRDHTGLDAAAQAVLPDARRAVTSASAGAIVEPSFTPLPSAFSKLHAANRWTVYGTPKALCIFFPNGMLYHDNTDYGFGYCPGTTTPEDAGLIGAKQLAPHWWVVTQDTGAD